MRAAIDPGTGATPKARNPLDIDELAERLVAAADAAGLTHLQSVGTHSAAPSRSASPRAIPSASAHSC
ncbi:hypothetical protein GCM10010255_01420 [Streptomyces coeruleofuscus]|uniref:Uncharacterized protein n=1 Tax=Streptomyces coeruleofuscus TaxID=66879 RepID=A0ABN3HH70_9ACTN